MAPAELRAFLIEHRLTTVELAARLGVGVRSVRRWTSADGRPPAWVDRATRDLHRELEGGARDEP